MGAYSPAPLLKKDCLNRIIKEIVEPTIDELNKKNIDYKGVIYFGLMITKSGPKVIEYNCRFGDPECQTIMPLMDQNFVFLLEKCSMGNLTGDEKIKISEKVSGCVIATSKGYPQEYKVLIHQRHYCLAFWITKSAVIFYNFGPRFCDH